jgi:hypothetical protein
MSSIAIFSAEILACLAVSTVILLRLQRLLRRIGSEVCERGGASTEFWIAYTQIMMAVAPILLVAWFSQAGQHVSVVAQLKSSISIVLCGQFLGLVLVGRAVWNMVKPAMKVPAPALPKAAPAA